MDDKSTIKFALSTESVKEIPFEKYNNDFTFIVDGEKYTTCRYIADFISPRIRQAHFVDKTINSFSINTTNKASNVDFSSILSLIEFQPTKLTQQEVDYFIDVFSALGNRRELLKLIPKYNNDITTKNVFNRIHNKQIYLQRFNSAHCSSEKDKEQYDEEASLFMLENKKIDDEIDFVSTHFYELDIEKVKKIDPQILEEIIKSDKLKLEDEDLLLKMIIDLYNENHEFSYFFKYVNFLYVSNDEFRHFTKVFDLTDIDGQIWSSIIERTLKSQVYENELQTEARNQRFKNQNSDIPLLYRENQEFNGIIKYLTSKANEQNIHESGTIEVTTNSFAPGRDPKYLLEFNYNHSYKPQQTDAWICFDFKKMKVKLTNYSIRSNVNGPNGHHLKSWDLEISKDGKTWIKIDERRFCPDLNAKLAVGTFDVQENDYSRYVRIHQVDKPWGGDPLFFYYIEFFGYLIKDTEESE